MVVAYMRGILKPDYPHGTRSRIREAALLKAIESEMEASLGYQRLMVSHSFISKITIDSVRRLQADSRDTWQRICHLRRLTKPPPAAALLASGKALGIIYTALEKSSVLEQIRARDMHIQEELANGLPDPA